MTSTSETGHAKNAANFQELISYCTGYGAPYNPSRVCLQIANLQTLRSNALAILQDVKVAKTTYDNAVNARQIAFKPVKPLATRIVNAIAASGASDLVIADARTINRKIQGSKANAAITPAPATPADTTTPPDKTKSTSQQSFDSIIDHLAKLIQTVSQESSYTPNETDLQVVSLNSLLTNLQTVNTSAVNAFTNWSNKRIERDKILYDIKTGLVEIALEVKQYVKSLFGASSPQFKQVSGIQFVSRVGK